MLNNEKVKASKFYLSYPNKNCKDVNMPPDKMVKGNFQQIVQLMGIGFEKRKTYNVLDLFIWSDAEEKHLNNLSFRNANMETRKYRHLCYLCELAYALCIPLQNNISSYPGWEWQLQYYGGSK